MPPTLEGIRQAKRELAEQHVLPLSVQALDRAAAVITAREGGGGRDA